jgi:hypothetical protein
MNYTETMNNIERLLNKYLPKEFETSRVSKGRADENRRLLEKHGMGKRLIVLAPKRKPLSEETKQKLRANIAKARHTNKATRQTLMAKIKKAVQQGFTDEEIVEGLGASLWKITKARKELKK